VNFGGGVDRRVTMGGRRGAQPPASLAIPPSFWDPTSERKFPRYRFSDLPLRSSVSSYAPGRGDGSVKNFGKNDFQVEHFITGSSRTMQFSHTVVDGYWLVVLMSSRSHYVFRHYCAVHVDSTARPEWGNLLVRCLSCSPFLLYAYICIFLHRWLY
jgi:hypothetical protein